MPWSRPASKQTGLSALSDSAEIVNSQKWLLTMSGPRDDSLKAGTDLALAAGAFGQSVKLVLAGDALKLLSPQTDVNDALWRLLGSLPYYDIESVHALGVGNNLCDWREDLLIFTMSRAEWQSAALEADILVHY